MGSGTWTTSDFACYTTSTKGMSVDSFTSACNLTVQSIYKAHSLNPILNPLNIIRKCCDSDEHPNTLPVILALDVTGSMGSASIKVAQKLNEIMTDLYSDSDMPDVEFCVMGIGDLAFDDAPIQMSQFESDIRIAEQLDAIYFEGGGGGNLYESYTAAWYMGLNHCELDCWSRNKKGIIITLGDELPNPYLPKGTLSRATGDTYLQDNVETEELLEKTREKFDVYHISIAGSGSTYSYHNRLGLVDMAWKKLLGDDNYFVANLDDLASILTSIIKGHCTATTATTIPSYNNEVTW